MTKQLTIKIYEHIQKYLWVELSVIVLPSFSVMCVLLQVCLVCVATGTWLAGAFVSNKHICLFVWPQGLGLLVLCEQHIGLPHPCFLLGQAQF